MEKSCQWCRHASDSLVACARCKSVFYCGAECQANAWADNKYGDGGVVHKDECHLLAEVIDIGARLSAASAAGASSLGADALLLIGKPVKRGASTSPEKDDTRETKKAAVATSDSSDPATDQQAARPRETDLRKVLYPLTRDVLRLISLMTLLDAASLMRASPAWRVLYEQIDWKAVILSQWDTPTRTQAFMVDSDRPVTVKEGVKSIGRWIADNSIYRLYPELASAVAASDMPEYEVLMSDLKRQEVLVEQEAERAQAGENEEEYDRKLNQLIDLSAREGEIKYQFLLRSFQSIVSSGVVEARRALMNICIAYRMYEHNVAVDQIYALRKAQSGARPDDDDDEDHDDNGAGPFPFFAIETLSKDIRGFFWRPIYREKWEEMGPPPKNLAELSAYARRLATRIDGINIPNMNIVAKNVRNFPRALTLCAQVITGVEVGRCPQWSDASFRNLSKMDRLEEIKVNGPLWSKANVDFYATCPRLKTVSILRAPHGMAFSVSPAVMRESSPGSGLFGACSPNPGRIQRFTFFTKESEILNEYTFERFAPRKLPPGPYAGLTRRAHIESAIRRAFLSYMDERPIRERRLFIDDNVLVETLLAELTAKKLFEAPDPKSEKEYEKLVETFCALLEKTGVSPVEAEQNLEDPGNIALPFRVWFNRGLEYILDGEPSKSGRARTTTKKAKQKQQQQGPSVIPSHARDACRISAERRRQVGAYPSLEELAEAMVAWRASVYNMAIAASRTRNGRVEYCKWIASKYVKDEKDAWRIFFRGERVDNREKSRDNATKYTWALEPPSFAYMGGSPNVLVVPHELVMAFVFHSARVMREGLKRRRYSVASFRRFFGDLPAWLWLADAAWSTLKLSLHVAPYVPPQLMYHPGLRTFYCDNSTGWGTPGNEVQWDLIDLAPEARPTDASMQGTKMHQYHHDFEGFIIEDAKQLKMSCFPPIRTQGYIDTFGIDFE